MNVLFNALFRYRVRARDRSLGRIKDVFFDSQSFGLRYIEVTVARYWPFDTVMIPIFDVDRFDPENEQLLLDVTAREARSCLPSWRMDGLNGTSSDPLFSIGEHGRRHVGERVEVHSCLDILGWGFKAQKQLIGRVEDFYIDVTENFVPYLVIERETASGSDCFLCPNFLFEEMDARRRQVTACMNPAVYMEAPPFQVADFSDEREKEIWDHFLNAYHASGAAEGTAGWQIVS